MPMYTPFVFCNECGKPHAIPIRITLPQEIAPDQSIANIYDGREVPENMNFTSNAVQCPKTGNMFAQKDNNQVFLVRVDGGGLPPWLRD